jgi:hypothetical protein
MSGDPVYIGCTRTPRASSGFLRLRQSGLILAFGILQIIGTSGPAR